MCHFVRLMLFHYTFIITCAKSVTWTSFHSFCSELNLKKSTDKRSNHFDLCEHCELTVMIKVMTINKGVSLWTQRTDNETGLRMLSPTWALNYTHNTFEPFCITSISEMPALLMLMSCHLHFTRTCCLNHLTCKIEH